MKAATPPPLVPVDLARCQTDIKRGNPFRIGDPIRWERCPNPPAYVTHEKEPDEFGRKGGMSLCESCHRVFLEKQPGALTQYEVVALKESPPREEFEILLKGFWEYVDALFYDDAKGQWLDDRDYGCCTRANAAAATWFRETFGLQPELVGVHESLWTGYPFREENNMHSGHDWLMLSSNGEEIYAVDIWAAIYLDGKYPMVYELRDPDQLTAFLSRYPNHTLRTSIDYTKFTSERKDFATYIRHNR